MEMKTSFKNFITKGCCHMKIADIDMAVINNEMLIHVDSLGLRVELKGGAYFCGLCRTRFGDLQQYQQHVQGKNAEHDEAYHSMPVVVVPDEFIREISPGQFHCGYCNAVISTWAATQAHLQLADHKKLKMMAKRMLSLFRGELHGNGGPSQV